MERKGPIAKVGGGFAFTKLDCSNKASPVFFLFQTTKGLEFQATNKEGFWSVRKWGCDQNSSLIICPQLLVWAKSQDRVCKS